MTFTVPAQLETELDELLTHYPEKRSAAVMFLHALQDHFGFITPEAMEWTAARLGLPPISVLELVTFYPMFRQQPVGKLHFKICRTLSCALAGSYRLHQLFCEKLGLDCHQAGPQTTPDGRCTVEFVECLAACGAAPVMMCNDRFYEKVTEAMAEKMAAEHGFEP